MKIKGNLGKTGVISLIVISIFILALSGCEKKQTTPGAGTPIVPAAADTATPDVSTVEDTSNSISSDIDEASSITDEELNDADFNLVEENLK